MLACWRARKFFSSKSFSMVGIPSCCLLLCWVHSFHIPAGAAFHASGPIAEQANFNKIDPPNRRSRLRGCMHLELLCWLIDCDNE
jgi:hypothetical protein